MFVELNGILPTAFTFAEHSVPAAKPSIARSVAFPPITFMSLPSPETTESVFLWIDSDRISFSFPPMSPNFFDSLRAPSMNVTASSLPLVMVPVLSENRIFREPAVSIPATFLTSTLSLSILPMFCAETIAIISGSPSGTAITMMMTASITDWITASSRAAHWKTPSANRNASMPPSPMTSVFMSIATAIAIPPM